MLFLGVRGFSDYAGPNNPLAYSVVVVLPSSTRPTDASVYASKNTSRCPPQDSRSGWIRYFLSCSALASPTTCRFSPAHSGLPTSMAKGTQMGFLLPSSETMQLQRVI